MQRADIVIVGGGFAGMSAAAALSDGRRRIIVLEAHRGHEVRFRGELIHPPGVDVLAELQLLAPLAAAGGVAVHGFAIVPGTDRAASVLPYREIATGRPTGFAMDHVRMLECLRREAVQRPGVEMHVGQRVTGVLREAGQIVGVQTADDEYHAELTIMAEGRYSKLRRALGIVEHIELLSFTAALEVTDADLPHPGYGHVFLGAWGPILAYPIGRRTVRMCFDLPTQLNLSHTAVTERLRSHYARVIPNPLRDAMLSALGRRDALEVCANHAVHTRGCTAPGAALIGDAGGCSHPLTATGMTRGLKDVRVLAEELRAGSGLDTALRRYERRRYQFVRPGEILADALYDVFRGDDSGPRAVRAGIFSYWEGREARAASMALLSGQEPRLTSFASEYLRVLGHAARCVLNGEVTGPAMHDRAEAISSLVKTSMKPVRRTLAMARSI